MTSAVGGIVFDKDGTLFDFARTWEAWAQGFLARLARSPQEVDLLGASIGFDAQSGHFARDSIVIAGTPVEIAQAVAPMVPHLSEPEIVALFNSEAARAPQVEAAPLEPLLRSLQQRGFRLGVATNDAQMPAMAHLGSAGITDYFDFIAGSDSGYGGKPAPGQLLAFAEHCQLNPQDCVMVGDSLHDLKAGRAAGFRCVGVLTGYASETTLAEFADTVLPHVGHLPQWLDCK